MKTLKSLLCASLALAPFACVRAEVSAQAWLESYYLYPEPAELSRAIARLSHEGYFDRAENTAVAIGFFSVIFSRYPERVAGWLQPLGHLPAKHIRLLACAVWQAGHPAGAEWLLALSQSSPLRSAVEQLALTPSRRVVDVPVRSPSSMRLLWGAFLGTGDERYIVGLFDAFRSDDRSLQVAAHMALAHTAAAHPRVMEICRVQFDRQPEDIRAGIRAALSRAELISTHF